MQREIYFTPAKRLSDQNSSTKSPLNIHHKTQSGTVFLKETMGAFPLAH